MYNLFTQALKSQAHLSGWMRLWLVVSAAWIVSIMYIGYLWFPSDAQLMNEISSRYSDDFRKLDSELEQLTALCAQRSDTAGEILKCAIQSRSIKERKEILGKEVLRQMEFESQYFWKPQTIAILKALPLATLPPIVVLFLGVWVSKGFQKRS